MEPAVEIALIGAVVTIVAPLSMLIMGAVLKRKQDAIAETLHEVKGNVDGRLTQFIDLANRTQTELATLKALMAANVLHGSPELQAAIAAPAPAVSAVPIGASAMLRAIGATGATGMGSPA